MSFVEVTKKETNFKDSNVRSNKKTSLMMESYLHFTVALRAQVDVAKDDVCKFTKYEQKRKNCIDLTNTCAAFRKLHLIYIYIKQGQAEKHNLTKYCITQCSVLVFCSAGVGRALGATVVFPFNIVDMCNIWHPWILCNCNLSHVSCTALQTQLKEWVIE